MRRRRAAGGRLDGSEGPVTRRRMLRGVGAFGLGATASAGMAALFGTTPAYASTTATAPVGAGFPPQAALAPACSCKTLCSLDVGGCGGPCSPGSWCYYCNGCGIKGPICLSGCDGSQTCYWCA